MLLIANCMKCSILVATVDRSSTSSIKLLARSLVASDMHMYSTNIHAYSTSYMAGVISRQLLSCGVKPWLCHHGTVSQCVEKCLCSE